MKMVLEWIRKKTGVVRTTLGVDRGIATVKSAVSGSTERLQLACNSHEPRPSSSQRQFISMCSIGRIGSKMRLVSLLRLNK